MNNSQKVLDVQRNSDDFTRIYTYGLIVRTSRALFGGSKTLVTLSSYRVIVYGDDIKRQEREMRYEDTESVLWQ